MRQNGLLKRNPWKPMHRFFTAYFVIPAILYFVVTAGAYILGKPLQITAALSWTTAMPIGGLMLWRLSIYLDSVIDLSPEADTLAARNRMLGIGLFVVAAVLILISSLIVLLDESGEQTPQFVNTLNHSEWMPVVSVLFYAACLFFCLEQIMRAHVDRPGTRQSALKR